jgi:Uma2 family endonuclease
MAVTTKWMTAEEFWQRANEFEHCELVRGEVVRMSPTGGVHGKVAGNFLFYLRQFVDRHQLGTVFAAETGLILSRNPDIVRAPDVAFVSKERLPQVPRGFIPLAPDLAVEVVSPGDAENEVYEKVLEYLKAGTRLVLIAYPESRTIAAYRSLTDIRVLTEDDTLDGGDVLSGLVVRVSQIFE